MMNGKWKQTEIVDLKNPAADANSSDSENESEDVFYKPQFDSLSVESYQFLKAIIKHFILDSFFTTKAKHIDTLIGDIDPKELSLRGLV